MGLRQAPAQTRLRSREHKTPPQEVNSESEEEVEEYESPVYGADWEPHTRKVSEPGDGWTGENPFDLGGGGMRKQIKKKKKTRYKNPKRKKTKKTPSKRKSKKTRRKKTRHKKTRHKKTRNKKTRRKKTRH